MLNRRPIAERTRQILRDHALQLKKSLGQNFLTDSRTLEKIVAAADIDGETGVFEIGPGIGALTERLAAYAASVVCVEIDKRFIPILEKELAPRPNVFVKHGDILDVDVPNLIQTHFQRCLRVTAVGNLPYYITSPVIMRLLELERPFDRIVLLVQKEVAERMLASPGSKAYSMLSVAVQYYAALKKIANVPAHVFVPRPQVESVIVQLTPYTAPPVHVASTSQFFTVVRASFRERRKTLTNNLTSHLFTDWDKSRVNEWLTALDIDPSRRAETLSIAEFARMTNALTREHVE